MRFRWPVRDRAAAVIATAASAATLIGGGPAGAAPVRPSPPATASAQTDRAAGPLTGTRAPGAPDIAAPGTVPTGGARPGDVAMWDDDHNGAGGLGHVALPAGRPSGRAARQVVTWTVQ